MNYSSLTMDELMSRCVTEDKARAYFGEHFEEVLWRWQQENAAYDEGFEIEDQFDAGRKAAIADLQKEFEVEVDVLLGLDHWTPKQTKAARTLIERLWAWCAEGGKREKS